MTSFGAYVTTTDLWKRFNFVQEATPTQAFMYASWGSKGVEANALPLDDFELGNLPVTIVPFNSRLASVTWSFLDRTSSTIPVANNPLLVTVYVFSSFNTTTTQKNCPNNAMTFTFELTSHVGSRSLTNDALAFTTFGTPSSYPDVLTNGSEAGYTGYTGMGATITSDDVPLQARPDDRATVAVSIKQAVTSGSIQQITNLGSVTVGLGWERID